MKTKILIVMIMILMLSACSKSSERTDQYFAKYESAYETLSSHDKLENSSNYYNLEVVTNKIEDGTYRVDLILDKPQVAMYNVEMLVELNPTGTTQYDEVLPSLGIVEDLKYNLIPNQVNIDNGFYEGLILSGISDKSKGTLKVSVSWSNYASTKQFEEFIQLPYDFSAQAKDQDKVEDTTDEEVDENKDE